MREEVPFRSKYEGGRWRSFAVYSVELDIRSDREREKIDSKNR